MLNTSSILLLLLPGLLIELRQPNLVTIRGLTIGILDGG